MKTKTKPLEIWINTAVELKGAKAACRELDRQIKQAQKIGQGFERLERLSKLIAEILAHQCSKSNKSVKLVLEQGTATIRGKAPLEAWHASLHKQVGKGAA